MPEETRKLADDFSKMYNRLDEKGKFHLNQSRLAAYSHGEYFELGKRLGKFGFSVEKKKQKPTGGKRR